jgi:DNA-binding Lrp family transcriptional regulator
MPRNIGMKLISELMRNSRRSDRELARILGTSQPTVTCIRTKLEKEGFIREYTMIPDFCRIGYKLIAITFTDVRQILDRKENPEEEESAKQQREDWLANSIIMLERGLGLKHTGVILSLHKTYTDFTLFIQMLRKTLSSTTQTSEDTESFLIDLDGDTFSHLLTFSSLATHLRALDSQYKSMCLEDLTK